MARSTILITGWFHRFVAGNAQRRSFVERLSRELTARGAKLHVWDHATIEEPLALTEDHRHVHIPTRFPPYHGPSWNEQERRYNWTTPTVFDATRALFGVASATSQLLRYVARHGITTVMSYNSTITVHRFFRAALAIRRIPHAAAHIGMVPGTIEINTNGFAATARPIRFHKEFDQTPVTESERDELRRYLELIAGNPREDATASVRDRWQSLAKPPYFLLIGSGVFGNGLWPRWSRESFKHSPFFPNDRALLRHLLKIAERNKWTVVYRRHPDNPREELPSHPLLIVSDSIRGTLKNEIAVSHLCMTLVSSGLSEALMLGRAGVLIGRNGLSFSGACYEPHGISDLEPTLRSALMTGYTETHRAAFENRMTRLCHRYYYSESEEAERRFGRGPSEVADYLLRLPKGLES